MKIIETILDGIIVKETIYEENDYSTQEQKENWLSICETCESNKKGKCDDCGCLILTKINFNDSHCPINKW